MFVSVIIPNYNHARFLQQRIESVFAQTYTDFELIILDDCSKDNSSDIIKEYANHPRVTNIVFNKNNSGSTFQQWKKGVALAKAEWIWIAESDDYCDNTLLETLVSQVQATENVVLSYCQSYYREEGSQTVQDMSFYTNQVSFTHWKESYVNVGQKEINEYLLYINSIPNASAVLFKKEAYLKADKSFEFMKQCGDWFLWVQILKIGNLAFCAKALNNFRAHDTTTRVLDTVSKRRARLDEEYKIVNDIKKDLPHENKYLAEVRLNKLTKDYADTFTRNEIIKLLLWPFSHKEKIPYFKIVASKLKM